MKQLKRIMVLFGVLTVGAVVLAPPAGAKVLPYQLAVVSDQHSVGQPVNVVMYPHEQNVLPASFDFEVRRAKLPKPERVDRVLRSRGSRIMMHQVGPHEYRGKFIPQSAGLFVVYKRWTDAESIAAGYPNAILVVVQR